MTTGFIPQHGGFRKLRSFQTAQLAYDGTVIFCDRFIDKRSRTHDQMVQAARSGVQNIAEGSLASATCPTTGPTISLTSPTSTPFALPLLKLSPTRSSA